MQKIILFFTGLILLSGCLSTRSSIGLQNVVSLAPELDFVLFHPQTFQQSITMTQLAEIKTSESTHEIMFVLEIEPTHMTIVGLLPSGTRIFSINYDGTKIVSEGYNQLLEKLNPKYLLADVQLSLWPAEKLIQSWFVKQACAIKKICQFNVADATGERTISMAGKPLITINYGVGQQIERDVRFDNYLRDYQIALQSVE